MDYSYWNFNSLDCQFRHCGTFEQSSKAIPSNLWLEGPLNSHVGDPWAPILHRQTPLGIPLETRDQKKNRPVLRVICSLSNYHIDCPVDLIRRINSMPITRRKKALYYKVLYQETPVLYTLGQMYTNYYLHRTIDMSLYSNIERKFVYKCNYSDIPSREMYKWEYLKNTARN